MTHITGLRIDHETYRALLKEAIRRRERWLFRACKKELPGIEAAIKSAEEDP